jgi:transposase
VKISVGIDITEEIHWVTAIDAEGAARIDRKLLNTPIDIETLCGELAALRGTVRIGPDVIGGIAGPAQAMLAEAGFALVHIPGIAVNRRGENKSDPRDARTIAEQVRIRSDLRQIEPVTELDLEIRLFVSRRGDIAQAQTQRISRMRDLLAGIFPGLEACLDLRSKGALHLLTKFVTTGELRAAGQKRLVRHLRAAGGLPKVEDLANRVRAVAAEQPVAVPAERMTARLIRELAIEALVSRECLIELDLELEALLERHPDAALIRSLPGMGAVLAGEFIAEAGDLNRFRSADALASSAGMAPVLRPPGRMRFVRRPNGGNKSLERVFYQSAFCSLAHDDSRAFYQRKRRKGKRHYQAIIALARRRVNVLWAVVHSRTPFQTGFKTAARLRH